MIRSRDEKRKKYCSGKKGKEKGRSSYLVAKEEKKKGAVNDRAREEGRENL